MKSLLICFLLQATFASGLSTSTRFEHYIAFCFYKKSTMSLPGTVRHTIAISYLVNGKMVSAEVLPNQILRLRGKGGLSKIVLEVDGKKYELLWRRFSGKFSIAHMFINANNIERNYQYRFIMGDVIAQYGDCHDCDEITSRRLPVIATENCATTGDKALDEYIFK